MSREEVVEDFGREVVDAVRDYHLVGLGELG